MAFYKVCLPLAILWVSVNAIFEERFKSPTASDYFWMQLGDDNPHSFGSSDQSPSYSDFLESRKKSSFDSMEHFDGARDWLLAPPKKESRKDKHSKKMISPVYIIADKDSQKYKNVVFKSEVPYCQEIKARSMSKDNAKDSMVCYKCKNPKNGATYEQCSYVSQPMADGSSVEKVVETPFGYRRRRSNSEEVISELRDANSYRSRGSPYRFNEKVFSAATKEMPSEYRNKDETCEKVVKDSMVCMVCENTKSNGKYEQCSYVHQPSEKSYAFTKSSSFKNPESRRNDEEDDKEPVQREYSESKPIKGNSRDKESESYEESTDSSNCRKVEKDSKTCTVCKDPKTGGNYEKCSYTYQPDDKVYKFSRSKSFGYPRRDSSKEDSKYHEAKPSESLKGRSSSKESDEYTKDYSVPESLYEKSGSSSSSPYFKRDEPRHSYHKSTSDDAKSAPEESSESSGYMNSKSESQRIADNMEPSNCREVQKDSMTCKVCKDPKTGSNSEQCSYKYQPSDKSYSFTRSKSFGSPTDSGDKTHEGSEVRESREPSFKDRVHDFPSSKRSYASSRDSKDSHVLAAPSEPQAEVEEEPPMKSAPKKTGVDFSDAFKKKAEIQKFLHEFQKEDHSNCKKMMRDKMTCYQCVDEKGFRKEECAFVTSDNPEEASDSFKEETEEDAESTKKVLRSTVFEKAKEFLPLEPDASASANVEEKQQKPTADDSEEPHREVEPYEYVAETRPVFDKVLGFTLPAFMLSTSEHEKEFDSIMASRF